MALSFAEDATSASADRDAIQNRIEQLDNEQDVERVLEVNASTLALTGLALGLAVNKKWLVLPRIVLPILLQHGLQGWCPLLPKLRRLDIRTRGDVFILRSKMNTSG